MAPRTRNRATSAANDAAANDAAKNDVAPDADRPAGRHRDPTLGFQLDCGTGPEVPHVGIVFVHGIGSQPAGQTLLDWGGKIISVLLDARTTASDATGDPVIDSQLDPGPAQTRFIELQLPAATSATGDPIPEQHWVMTEAWWANRVRPPAFGEMAEWLGPRGAIARIVLAMLPRGREEHDPRLRPAAAVYPLRHDHEERSSLVGSRLGGPDRRVEIVREDADRGSPYAGEEPTKGAAATVMDVGTLIAKLGAGLYFQAISALVLVLYGALRSVEKLLPFGPLKDGALTRPIDRFVLDWFGDVYVLLRDPAQAASVRGRLIEAIGDLDRNGCDSIAVVAHSGGAIVSYMTLADESRQDLKVDRLITLGEGLNLAWRLTTGEDGKIDADTRRRYDRLYSDVFAKREKLRWDDFWGSQDPAPVGVLQPDPETMGHESLKRIRSHAIWNRLSFSEDHGSYWDNDEEFLMPLVQLLDLAEGGGRMFATAEPTEQSNRRRQRLSFLSVWRQLSLVAPTAAIVTSFAAGSNFIQYVGQTMAFAFGKLPGNEVISGPVTAIRSWALRDTPIGGFLAESGVWVVAALVGLLTVVSLIAPPERPVPWFDSRQKPNSATNVLRRLLEILPWAVAVPVGFNVVMSGARFIGNSTPDGVHAGQILLGLVLGALGLAGAIFLWLGSPFSSATVVRRGRDTLEIAATIFLSAVMTLVAVSPFVAVVLYEQAGDMVLGLLTILGGFQVIARVGTWRWSVWDSREREAARRNRQYPWLVRIVIQMGLLIVTVLVAMAGVVYASPPWLAAAAGLGAAAVLLGVAVDVFDTARRQSRGAGVSLLAAKK